MKLVVGLGNPGKAYAFSRHNAGFMVVEELARRQGVALRKMFWVPASQAACRLGGQEVRLIEPSTYMNRSGRAVRVAMGKWRAVPADLVVVYDDAELDLGAVRVRAKGSGGSHNGVKSVQDWLDTGAFARVRVGVGPKPAGADLAGFVLGPFAAEDSLKLEKVVGRAADAVESVFSAGIGRTMDEFNRPAGQAKEKDH